MARSVGELDPGKLLSMVGVWRLWWRGMSGCGASVRVLLSPASEAKGAAAVPPGLLGSPVEEKDDYSPFVCLCVGEQEAFSAVDWHEVGRSGIGIPAKRCVRVAVALLPPFPSVQATSERVSGCPRGDSERRCIYLVDPASSHMLVSKIKPCMCEYRPP